MEMKCECIMMQRHYFLNEHQNRKAIIFKLKIVCNKKRLISEAKQQYSFLLLLAINFSKTHKKHSRQRVCTKTNKFQKAQNICYALCAFTTFFTIITLLWKP